MDSPGIHPCARRCHGGEERPRSFVASVVCLAAAEAASYANDDVSRPRPFEVNVLLDCG